MSVFVKRNVWNVVDGDGQLQKKLQTGRVTAVAVIKRHCRVVTLSQRTGLGTSARELKSDVN